MKIMIKEQFIPSSISQDVRNFCYHLSPETKPIYVPVITEPYAKRLSCFPNVQTKVKNDGGTQVFGWSISERIGLYLESQHHSVWRSSSGILVDITPTEVETDKVLFLEDPRLTYTGTTFQHRHYALGDPAKVQKYISIQSTLLRSFGELVSCGYMPGDPVFKRLNPLMSEMETLRHEIRSKT